MKCRVVIWQRKINGAQAIISPIFAPKDNKKTGVGVVSVPHLLDVKAKLFCPEIAGLFCRIAGLFCHDSRANLSLKPVCFGIAIS